MASFLYLSRDCLERKIMIKISKDEMNRVFVDYWSTLQEEFFKLETLQYYAEDANSANYRMFQQGKVGDAVRSLQELIASQKEFYDTARHRKISLTRLHVVSFPLSEYLNYEIESYKICQKFGEQICLVSLADVDKTTLPCPLEDFLLFDEEKLICHSFDLNGIHIYSKVSESKKEIQPFVRLKYLLKYVSLPLDDFLKKHNIRP